MITILSTFPLSTTNFFNQRQTTKHYLYEMMNISSHKQVEKIKRTEVLSLIKVLDQHWISKLYLRAILNITLKKTFKSNNINGEKYV